MTLEEDKRKVKSWWNSYLATSYINITIMGIVFAVVGVVVVRLPGLLRIALSIFGIILAVAGLFAARQRVNKI